MKRPGPDRTDPGMSPEYKQEADECKICLAVLERCSSGIHGGGAGGDREVVPDAAPAGASAAPPDPIVASVPATMETCRLHCDAAPLSHRCGNA
jgi:hypothetical protein